jgi:two-component system, OmpR family, response regulator RegX3
MMPAIRVAMPDRDPSGEAASTGRVLVVEDESALADSIAYSLSREGYLVVRAEDGERALERFRSELPSIVILDLMLPKLSGLDVCRAIRAESQVPIVILTAKDSEADKVAGLELGADDYVTKPFSMRELVSRVRAHLRRADMSVPSAAHSPDTLAGGPIEMDPDRHEVLVKGEHVPMTPKEFELLELFLSRKGRLLTRQFLIDEVWGPDYVGDTKTLDVHVKRLRQKIEEDRHRPRHLLTVRGLGYKFVD